MDEQQVCLLERFFKRIGFILIHDGQRNPEQFSLPPEEVKCFIRKYRWQVDGKLINTWAIFKYDKRSQFADFELYSRDPELKGREKMLLTMEDNDGTKELANKESSRSPTQASYNP